MSWYKIADFSIFIECAIENKNLYLKKFFRVFTTHSLAFFSLLIKMEDYDYLLFQRKKLLYQNENSSYPTVVYQLENETYEFCFFQGDTNNKLIFHISPDWKVIRLIENSTTDDGYDLFNRLGVLFNIVVLNFHACVFHGVVMEYNGLGILVMAPSGVGKTTHTNMWEQYEDALIINGDRCLCRCIDGTWYAYGMPWAGSSGKILNRRVKINAIVDLSRGNINKAEVVSKFDAEVYLLQRIFAPVTYGHLQDLAFNHVHEIASEIPVIHFECRPDRESVQVLKEKVLEITSG